MRERTARPIARLVGAVAVLAMAATACGGGGAASDEDPTAPPAATEPAEAPAEDSPADEEPGGDAAGEDAAGEPQPPATAAPTGNTPSTPAPEAEDGTHPSLIVEAEAGTLTVDRIEILSGAAAAAARAEDGEPPAEPGVDLPYLRNRNPRLRTLPVADDVTVRVYDCSSGCTLVPWTYADLVAGKALPYGTPDTPFEVTARDGEAVEIAEVYLP